MYLFCSSRSVYVKKKRCGRAADFHAEWGLSVQACSASESSEAPTLFRNGLLEQVLREYLGYDPKRQD